MRQHTDVAIPKSYRRPKEIATPVCGLVRNDTGFVTHFTELAAIKYDINCHCEEHSDVAIRSPLHFKLQFTGVK